MNIDKGNNQEYFMNVDYLYIFSSAIGVCELVRLSMIGFS